MRRCVQTFDWYSISPTHYQPATSKEELMLTKQYDILPNRTSSTTIIQWWMEYCQVNMYVYTCICIQNVYIVFLVPLRMEVWLIVKNKQGQQLHQNKTFYNIIYLGRVQISVTIHRAVFKETYLACYGERHVREYARKGIHGSKIACLKNSDLKSNN